MYLADVYFIETINRTTQLHHPITFDYFEHQPITAEVDKNEKTTIFVAEKANFFGKKVFSGE